MRLHRKLALYVIAAALSLGQTACRQHDVDVDASPPPHSPLPEYVYVPGSDVEVRVTIEVPDSVRRGQPVRLHARRETLGSWKRVRSSSLAEDSVWYAAPPPREEAEVAANLTWKTEPPLAMRLDSGLGSLRLGREREAVFKESGSYKVWALSSSPFPAKSNVVIVQVR